MKSPVWLLLIVAQVALFCFAAPLNPPQEREDGVAIPDYSLASRDAKDSGLNTTLYDLERRQNIPKFYGSESGPHYLHVEQGNVGNCWLIAAIKTIAKKEPSLLKNMMDYDAAKGVVTVTVPADPRNKMSQIIKHPVKYKDIVNRKTLLDIPEDDAWWPRALVDAVQKVRGVSCQKGNSIHRGFELVLGKKASVVPIEKKITTAGLAKLFKDVKSSTKVVMVSTKAGKTGFREPAKGKFLVDDHSYGVTGFNAVEKSATLLNPWPPQKDKKTGKIIRPVEKPYPLTVLAGLLDSMTVVDLAT